MESEGSVSISGKDRIAIITFGHPKGNSLTLSLLKRLSTEILKASENINTQVIVLKSEGTTSFCGGASFDEMLKVKDVKQGKEYFMGFAGLINAMRLSRKFIITRVQGKAVGGAVGIIAASDYVFATNISHIKLSELSIGIGPFVIGPAVERKIGKAAFSSLVLDTDWHDSYWAKNTGLYTKVFASITELDEETNKLASHLSKYSPEALFEMRKILWEGTDNWDTLLEQRAEINAALVLSDFTKKYLKNFGSK